MNNHIFNNISEDRLSFFNRQQENCPIIIDNGSYRCRAGWANESLPSISIPQYINKIKCDEKTFSVIIGKELKESHYKDSIPQNIKSPYEKDIVYHFEAMEYILDHIFSSLGVISSSIDQPILMTETCANLNYSREKMNELLFECYDVSSICYGIDSLFSLYYNKGKNYIKQSKHSIIVNLGHHSTTIYPVINDKCNFQHVIKIPVGGFTETNFLYQSLGIQNFSLKSYLDDYYLEKVISDNCYISLDYKNEINHIKKEIIELPINKPNLPEILSADKIKSFIKDLSRDENKIKKEVEKKKIKLLEQFNFYNLLILQRNKQILNEDGFKRIINKIGYQKKTDFDNSFYELKNIFADVQENEIENSFQKLYTYYENKHLISSSNSNRVKTRNDSRKNKKLLMNRNQDIFLNNGEKYDDGEWGNNDSVVYQNDYTEINNVLQSIDPNRLTEKWQYIYENFSIGLKIEKIRIPEILFQPSIIGISTCGIGEGIETVLNKYNADDRSKFIKNIFLCGGGSHLKNIEQRIKNEIISISPINSEINVYKANDPIYDSWKGCCYFANTDLFDKVSIKRSDYLEYGNDYFVEHNFSNVKYPEIKVVEDVFDEMMGDDEFNNEYMSVIE